MGDITELLGRAREGMAAHSMLSLTRFMTIYAASREQDFVRIQAMYFSTLQVSSTIAISALPKLTA